MRACIPPKQWICVVDVVSVLEVVNRQFIYFISLLVMGCKCVFRNFGFVLVFFHSELNFKKEQSVT